MKTIFYWNIFTILSLLLYPLIQGVFFSEVRQISFVENGTRISTEISHTAGFATIITSVDSEPIFINIAIALKFTDEKIIYIPFSRKSNKNGFVVNQIKIIEHWPTDPFNIYYVIIYKKNKAIVHLSNKKLELTRDI